jgi:flagellar export protein FliJ
MADLDSLIKHRKHIVEEKQRFLSQLYQQAERLEQQKQVVLKQIEKEKAMAAAMERTDMAAYLGRYLEGARRKIDAIGDALGKLEIRIAAAQEDMRAAFAEQKKVEVVQRAREAEEAKAQKRKEEQALDEVALEGFRRKNEKEEGRA